MSTAAATDSQPLRRAYRDILLFAGWVREGKLASSRYTELRAWVDRTLRAERSQLLRAGLDEELVADAQLIAIALVDEAVQAGPARDLAEQWGRDTLQYAQYKHNNLGRDFFDRLDYWQRRPDVPLGLLELFARVLSWGFEGRYREENRLGDLRTLRESLQNDLIRRTGSLPPLAPPLSALAKLPLPPPIVRAPWVFGMGTSLLLALGLVLTLLLHMHAGRVSHELSTAPAGGSEGESGAAPR